MITFDNVNVTIFIISCLIFLCFLLKLPILYCLKTLKIFVDFLHAEHMAFLNNVYEDNENIVRIPKNYNWKTPKHSWIYQRIWIPEQLRFFIRKTAQIKYGREEVNRKLNKILLHELTIDASLETEIQLVDEKEHNDLIGTNS